VAGGRAAAAYARIIGQPLPRGDLMRFLEPAEVAEHAPLAALMAAMDALVAAHPNPNPDPDPDPNPNPNPNPDPDQVAALEAEADLAGEMAGCSPLAREEVQRTCCPG